MIGSGDVARSPISKAVSADFISVTDPARALGVVLLKLWKWLTRHSRGVLTRGVSRRLRVAETVSLGEKRFVSILQVDGEQFLVGGSPSNVVLLAKLEARPETFGPGSFENIFSHVESGTQGSDADSKNSVRVTR
jgi:flagellar biogenesis protein FliO